MKSTTVKTVSTTLIGQVKKARSIKSLKAILSDSRYTASNPKTIRRQKRAIKAKVATLTAKKK